MNKIVAILGAVLLLVGGVAVAAYANPPAGGPSGQGECGHGNSDKPCKPDPQPGHGQDCDEHGNHGGVNEDHCISTDTVPTTTTTGHTPVTVCHKPGTPAEQTLVVDDDAVPGHLGHGDYLGECETTPTDTTPTEPTPTTPTPTTERCVPVNADKDGGVPANGDTNDDCAAAAVPPPAVATVQVPPTQATLGTTAAVAPPTTVTPAAKPKPKPKQPVVHKPKPDKPVKLTGNPKVDECKQTESLGVMNCKGVLVVAGNG